MDRNVSDRQNHRELIDTSRSPKFRQTETKLAAERVPDERLKLLEKVIEKGWKTFLEVGQALADIRDERLYRNHFPTFDSYCRQRWHYGRAYAYQLIGAAQVVERLSAIADIPLPTNESQVRPLIGLDPEDMRQAWLNAVKHGKTGRVTARLVKKSACEFRRKINLRKKNKISASRYLSKAEISDEIIRVLDTLSEHNCPDISSTTSTG